MDPQAFTRLSVGSLGLRIPKTILGSSLKSWVQALSSQCSCDIKLPGFPVQATPIPLMSSPDATPDGNSVPSSFYLEESDLRALLTPRCFYSPHACLEIVVFIGKRGSHGGVGVKRQQIGKFKLDVGPEWGEGKPVILFNGWIGIGKNKGDSTKPGPELHLRVKLDPDPRFVFQFEDITTLSPQIVQLRGSVKQPIFSCEFSRDRVSHGDPLSGYCSSLGDVSELEAERRERKGWKVKIHDLSGFAVAAAFITTPFVPSTGCDWVTKSNPGAWLVVRPDPCRPDSWQPWGKLEAWRERGLQDSICCRFHLLSNWQGDGDVLMSEVLISAEKGGDFVIDMDRQMLTTAGTPVPSPQSSGDFSGLGPSGQGGGFVMSCRVQGEGKSSKPVVQLAMRHIMCVEDAAIFMALSAAVDLSIVACKPFRRTGRSQRRFRHYSW
ncbi:PREDICTED: uncharacterized protein LOC104820818 [Tarenaya hassleriana]|uniref:uncharacterized protein LOC104820818 n=1 Tax=Tarenaya hassleriana TaxID=28532 RepID=UPI00053C67E3|nr:PREDICTED: uncharacterized protein LOC104820818 [Tarenaya hassleriana]XP_019058936.1 PREDICTED: uncharacterized protein LOC104820818 [Tarenaya hassleriana]